jgi:hypothetical protein
VTLNGLHGVISQKLILFEMDLLPLPETEPRRSRLMECLGLKTRHALIKEWGKKKWNSS